MKTSKDILIPEGGWLDLNHERIPAPTLQQRSWFLRSLSRVARAFRRPDIPNVFLVFYTHPRLFWAWLFFASRLFPFGRLPARLREKLIVRTAWNSRCRYEWVQHIELALSVGVTEEEVFNLSKEAEAMQKPKEILAIKACDQLLQQKVIDDETWKALSEHFSHRQLIEIMILVGHYDMLAGFIINAGVQLEPHLEAFMEGFNQKLLARLDSVLQ